MLDNYSMCLQHFLDDVSSKFLSAPQDHQFDQATIRWHSSYSSPGGLRRITGNPCGSHASPLHCDPTKSILHGLGRRYFRHFFQVKVVLLQHNYEG